MCQAGTLRTRFRFTATGGSGDREREYESRSNPSGASRLRACSFFGFRDRLAGRPALSKAPRILM